MQLLDISHYQPHINSGRFFVGLDPLHRLNDECLSSNEPAGLHMLLAEG